MRVAVAKLHLGHFAQLCGCPAPSLHGWVPLVPSVNPRINGDPLLGWGPYAPPRACHVLRVPHVHHARAVAVQVCHRKRGRSLLLRLSSTVLPAATTAGRQLRGSPGGLVIIILSHVRRTSASAGRSMRSDGAVRPRPRRRAFTSTSTLSEVLVEVDAVILVR